MFSLGLGSNLIVHEGDKRLPVVVHLDAPELQQGLGPLSNPTHPPLSNRWAMT